MAFNGRAGSSPALGTKRLTRIIVLTVFLNTTGLNLQTYNTNIIYLFQFPFPLFKGFKAFLMSVYEMPFEERIKRRQQIEARYIHICGIGEKSEPTPIKVKGKRGRYKRTKGRNLVERLIKEQNTVLAFAFNREVLFTNNLAERDIRTAKIKQKISNCFRTFTGVEIYARIEGFVSTARKHNQNVFQNYVLPLRNIILLLEK